MNISPAPMSLVEPVYSELPSETPDEIAANEPEQHQNLVFPKPEWDGRFTPVPNNLDEETA